MAPPEAFPVVELEKAIKTAEANATKPAGPVFANVAIAEAIYALARAVNALRSSKK